MKTQPTDAEIADALLSDRDRLEDVVNALAEHTELEAPERWTGGFLEWLEAWEELLNITRKPKESLHD